MKFPPFDTAKPVTCRNKGCPAIAFRIQGDARPFVIECGSCKDYVRGETEAEAERLWRERWGNEAA